MPGEHACRMGSSKKWERQEVGGGEGEEGRGSKGVKRNFPILTLWKVYPVWLFRAVNQSKSRPSP